MRKRNPLFGLTQSWHPFSFPCFSPTATVTRHPLFIQKSTVRSENSAPHHYFIDIEWLFIWEIPGNLPCQISREVPQTMTCPSLEVSNYSLKITKETKWYEEEELKGSKFEVALYPFLLCSIILQRKFYNVFIFKFRTFCYTLLGSFLFKDNCY